MQPFQLNNRPGTGTYNKGQERILEILQAAYNIVIDSGYHGLTTRKIAAAVDITLGHLQYYYPSKHDLVVGLIDHVIEGYMQAFDQVKHGAGQYPEDQLEAVIRYLIDDDATRETTHFFPEIWALANHDSHAADRMHEMYRKTRLVLSDLIVQLNPKLSPESIEHLALYVSTVADGLLPFVGYEKPFNSNIFEIKNIAVKSIINFVKLATNEDIAGAKLNR